MNDKQRPTHALTINHGFPVILAITGRIRNFLRYLLVPPGNVRRAHGKTIILISLSYAIPSFLIFGPAALLLLLMYQAGFTLLLRGPAGT